MYMVQDTQGQKVGPQLTSNQVRYHVYGIKQVEHVHTRDDFTQTRVPMKVI